MHITHTPVRLQPTLWTQDLILLVILHAYVVRHGYQQGLPKISLVDGCGNHIKTAIPTIGSIA
jgi:hypothetical protein